MKKQHYIYGLFAAALALGACDYNEDNFPGFDELAHPKHVWNDTISLANADYKAIAELEANKELALSKDPEGESYKAALEAVADNKFFTEDAPAAWYLPAYIAKQYPYMDNQSKVTVHYSEFASLPAYITALGAAKEYDLGTDDYKTVWGEGQSVSFISPSTLNKIPQALEVGISSPKDGEVRVVNYAWSDTEPSFGGGGEPEVIYTPIADMLKAGEGDYNVKGEVVATYGKGFLLGDETGSVLVYLSKPANYSVGDVLTVSGTTSSYNGLMQFTASSTVTFVERSEEFAYPAATAMTGAELDAYAGKPEVKYASITGVLSLNGNFYNLAIDGCTRQGSVSYPVNGLIDPALNGQNVTVTGYLIGATSKYVNVMATSVLAAGTESEYQPVGVVALSEVGEYKVKGSVVALYKRGFLLNDGTGSILVYLNKESGNKIGDVVTVNGKTSPYAGLMQFGTDAVVETVTAAGEGFSYEYPTVRVLEATDMDAYLDAPFVGYVQYTGQLKLDGNYMNVIIAGAEKAQGSLSYVLDGQVDASLDGKNIIVTGYAIGVSGGKFLNTMVLKVEEATAAASAFALTRAAVKPNASALYVYSADAKAWSKYVSDVEADVCVLQPADYTQMGYDYVSKPAETIPVYLSMNYPYAKADDLVGVVYVADKEGNLGATEFKFDGAAWVMTSEAAPAVMTFQKAEGEWVEARVYLESSLLDGQDGGFVAEDIVPLPSGNVWLLDKGYGWKGSGYAGGANLDAESYLVSPEIDLTKAAAPTVVFDCAINFLKGADRKEFFNLVVSTDYEGDASAASWENVEVNGWPEGTSWTFSTIEPASLAKYVGKKVRIAFHYKSTTAVACTVEVKNLSVKE